MNSRNWIMFSGVCLLLLLLLLMIINMPKKSLNKLLHIPLMPGPPRLEDSFGVVNVATNAKVTAEGVITSLVFTLRRGCSNILIVDIQPPECIMAEIFVFYKGVQKGGMSDKNGWILNVNIILTESIEQLSILLLSATKLPKSCTSPSPVGFKIDHIPRTP